MHVLPAPPPRLEPLDRVLLEIERDSARVLMPVMGNRKKTMDVMPKRAARVLAVLFMTLTGCTTAEELRQKDEAACVGYGFQRGTAEFAICLQRESIGRRYSYQSYWMRGYYSPYWTYGPHW